jgi:hypothetical protein
MQLLSDDRNNVHGHSLNSENANKNLKTQQSIKVKFSVCWVFGG